MVLATEHNGSASESLLFTSFFAILLVVMESQNIQLIILIYDIPVIKQVSCDNCLNCLDEFTRHTYRLVQESWEV